MSGVIISTAQRILLYTYTTPNQTKKKLLTVPHSYAHTHTSHIVTDHRLYNDDSHVAITDTHIYRIEERTLRANC
jgi:hypothetical protein